MAFGRYQWRRIIVAVTLATALGLAPAMAADSPLLLAQKAMKAGKTDLALRALNAALSGGSLQGADIAKAYYLRGLANTKMGNQTAAISDLNNALWLKGLSEAERQDALAAKTAAYQAAGAPAQVATRVTPVPIAKTQAEVVSVPAAIEEPSTEAAPASPKREAKAASAETTASVEALPWQGKAMPAPETPEPGPASPAAANPLSSLLGGLFNLGEPTPAAASPPPQAEEPAAAPARAAPAWKTAGATDPAATATSPSRAARTGSLYLQLASLRTPVEADAFSAKLTSEHAAAIAGLEPSVAPSILGNMGTFYTVRLGPVASKAAGSAVCAKLRKEGVDCFFSTP